MKKFFCVFLFVSILSLSGCGEAEKEDLQKAIDLVDSLSSHYEMLYSQSAQLMSADGKEAEQLEEDIEIVEENIETESDELDTLIENLSEEEREILDEKIEKSLAKYII
jgi:uncharacterized protein YfbU (UPF0304 family)